MEIQESVLRNVHLIMGWPAAPRYADLRGALTEAMQEIAGPSNDWTWDGPTTFVLNEDRGIDLALSPTELVIATEAPQVDAGDIPKELAALILDQLGIAQVRLIGTGAVWLAPVSDVEELNKWLSDQLGPLGKPGIYDAFGGRPSRFALETEINDEGFSYDVEFRPITASEAAEADDFKSDEEDDFPPAALYLEVRRSEAGEISPELAPQAFADNLDKALTAGHKFDLAIREGL